MRLRRTALPQTRRQKLDADSSLERPPSAFLYLARRSERERNTGRQIQLEQQTASSSRQFGHFWLQRFGVIILLVAVIASAANVLTLSVSAKVVPLATGDNQSFLRSDGVYQAAADQKLKSSVWNRNKVTIDTAKLSQQLLAQFPELSSVSITVPLLAHRPIVYIQPAQAALVLAGSQGSFIIDTAGKALAATTSSATPNKSQLPVVNDQSGLVIKLNRQALSAASVDFIQTVIAQLAAKQFTVSGMTLPAGTSELDVQLAGQQYIVKFNLESTNSRGEAGTFLATITQLRRQNITPAKYVDVRVDGRAYYQ